MAAGFALGAGLRTGEGARLGIVGAAGPGTAIGFIMRPKDGAGAEVAVGFRPVGLELILFRSQYLEMIWKDTRQCSYFLKR